MAKNPKVFVGDHGPVSVMQNGLQVAGAVKEPMTGEGHIGWDAPYKADIPEVKVFGKGEQKTLTGKNLAIMPTEKTKVSNGVTWTLNSDGTVTASGVMEQVYSDGFVVKLILPVGKYCTSRLCTYVITRNGKRLYLDGTFEIFDTDDTSTSYYYTHVSASVGSNVLETLKPQIEVGNIATPYEPYCGGIPAPNPEYPIEPEFLEMAEIACRGRNLIVPKTSARKDHLNGIDVDIVADNVLHIYGKPASRSFSYLCHRTDNEVKLYPGFKYKAIVFGEIPIGCRIAVEFVHTNGTYGQFIDSLSNEKHESIEFSVKNVEMLGMYFDTQNSTSYIDITIKCQLAIVPSTNIFEPYFSGGSAQLPILRALPDGSVRDEIDLETGKITRNIYEYTYTGDAVPGESCFNLPNRSLCVYFILPEHGYIPAAKSNVSTKNVVSNCFISSTYALRENLKTYTVRGRVDLYNNDMWMPLASDSIPLWRAFLKAKYDSGNPVKVWYALETPIVEYVDPAILKQHPGYTQLIQQGGFEPTQIDVTPYTELAFPKKNSK